MLSWIQVIFSETQTIMYKGLGTTNIYSSLFLLWQLQLRDSLEYHSIDLRINSLLPFYYVAGFELNIFTVYLKVNFYQEI